MRYTFGNVFYLFLFLFVVALGVILFRFFFWRRKARLDFAQEKFQGEVLPEVSFFSRISPVLYFLGWFFLILSMVDVLKGEGVIPVRQKVQNIYFLLDVSNSMNAQDISPSRLEGAKALIKKILPDLRNDRLGLAVFAGEAFSIMPLTTDFSAVENYVEAIETSVVRVQGTDFLKAIEVVAKKLKNVPKEARTVVIISDGEENERNENKAVDLAKKEGITLITVGIGTEAGAPIPEYMYGQLMGYKLDMDGEVVQTRRASQTLKNMANSTGGVFIDGNDIHLAKNELVKWLRNKKTNTRVIIESRESGHYFQYFLVLSFFLFFSLCLFNPKKDFNL
ncbi:MAG: VWA domain-containing protein [Bergeyella sp.]|nr:VWA domain-containing protein [Bergeyella sp.]